MSKEMLLRWGIAGCGSISHDFTLALSLLPKAHHQVTAVGASTFERAAEFASNYVPDAVPHASYNALITDNNVDIIYVGLVNPLHKETVVSALEHGKHVLCEKPMGCTADEVKHMVDVAKQNKRFLMEGFWSRFFPVYDKIREEIAKGTIGTPTIITGSFGYNFASKLGPGADVKLDPKMGGGSLSTVGCYLSMAASFIFGGTEGQVPSNIHASGFLNDHGGDETVSICLQYPGKRMGQFLCSTKETLVGDLCIFGSNATNLRIPSFMWCPTQLEVNGTMTEYPLPDSSHIKFQGSNRAGFVYEAEAVRHAIIKGLLESPVMPLSESILLAETLDQIRKQLGVRFLQD